MKYLLYILSLISSFAFGQRDVVVLTVDHKEVQVGDPLVVTIKSSVSGNLELNFPDEFVSGSAVQNGMNQEMDFQTGKVKTIYFYAKNGAFTKEGKYTFSATISSKNKVYRSKNVVVKVTKAYGAKDEITRRNLRQPFFGIIERSKPMVYEGEALILNGKIYSKLPLDFNGYQPFEVVGNAEAISINTSNELIFNTENLKGQKFASATFGKQLLFFSTPGKYTIQPFELAVMYESNLGFAETARMTSNSNVVEVLPLPANAPNDFGGGVGKFKMQRSINVNELKQGEVVQMKVTISGAGNLQHIDVPEIKLPKGVVIYGDPEVEEKFHYGLRGAEGKVHFTYNLQLIDAGVLRLPELTWSYFDPELKKYVTIREKSVQVSSDKNIDFQAELPEEVEEEIEPSNQQITAANQRSDTKKNSGSFYQSAYFWPTVLSPVALALLLGFWMKGKKNPTIEKPEVVSETKEYKAKTNVIHDLLDSAQLEASKGNVKEGFGFIELALRWQAALILNEDDANLCQEEISNCFADKQIPDEQIKQFKALLLRCQEAKYAFLNDENAFQTTFEETKKLVEFLAKS